jgi:hypothetical protein
MPTQVGSPRAPYRTAPHAHPSLAFLGHGEPLAFCRCPCATSPGLFRWLSPWPPSAARAFDPIRVAGSTRGVECRPTSLGWQPFCFSFTQSGDAEQTGTIALAFQLVRPLVEKKMRQSADDSRKEAVEADLATIEGNHTLLAATERLNRPVGAILANAGRGLQHRLHRRGRAGTIRARGGRRAIFSKTPSGSSPSRITRGLGSGLLCALRARALAGLFQGDCYRLLLRLTCPHFGLDVGADRFLARAFLEWHGFPSERSKLSSEEQLAACHACSSEPGNHLSCCEWPAGGAGVPAQSWLPRKTQSVRLIGFFHGYR